MAEPDDYERRIAEAVMQAIFDTSVIDVNGKPTAYIRTAEVCSALVRAMAGLMEGVPQCQTPKGMRDLAQATGKRLHTVMQQERKRREAGGERPFGADVATIN